MDTMTLRDAARRTSRSVTTLRRYIRSGRLNAAKRPGRFGPEYCVTETDLSEAGLEPRPDDSPTELVRRDARGPEAGTRSLVPSERLAHESVPISLYQELQMKHEQLLVQYGMVRASGMRVMELRAELEAKRRELEESEACITRLRRKFSTETGRLKQLLRRVELDQEGRGLEIAALREKVRALEMLTRNAATNDTLEKQFGEVMAQMRRVDRLTARRDAPLARDPAPPERPETDH